MVRRPKDVGASLRARLLDIARRRGQPFDVVLTMFVLERLLFRLATSRFSDRFVLKGAMLLTAWLPDPQRVTRDLDLLGYGEDSPEAMIEIFREVTAIHCEDGVAFDAAALRANPIRQQLAGGGLRLRTTASLSGARVPVVVDVGFGDAVDPGLEEIDYPVLLDLPAPRLKAYSRETVIAEKFQAMVALGRANSRMKDFYDVWILSRTFDHDARRLAQAVSATFERRGTEIPSERPDALTPGFASLPDRATQWRSFIADFDDAPPALSDVVEELARFLMPAALAAAGLTEGSGKGEEG